MAASLLRHETFICMNNACDTSICDVGRVQPQVARFHWMTRAPHAIYRVLASWIATIGARGWEDSTSPARPQSLPILRNSLRAGLSFHHRTRSLYKIMAYVEAIFSEC